MAQKMNGRQAGDKNAKAFQNWVSERSHWQIDDWRPYVNRQGGLNRSAIATELCFARECWRTNERLQQAIESLESDLRERAILMGGNLPPEVLAANRRASEGVSDLLAVNSQLSNKIATLEAQNRQLLADVARYRKIQEHLDNTGRLLKP